MMYVGLYVRIKPPVEGAVVPPAGYVALVCIYLFASFFQWGWGPVSDNPVANADHRLITVQGLLDLCIRNPHRTPS